ncbi:MAG: enoyl-CoA hydratase-related protein [bacterium]|nr:enoyl-CoA hydratase/isomerase family protein [bacterium]MBU1916646.1 enoyl-CoA hydratase/isomerase family protein [bacterium]
MKEVLYNKKNAVATITLNRPETLNAMTGAMMGEFVSCMEEAKDPAVRAIVLKANGRAFCAGGDLNYFKKLIDQEKVFSQDLLKNLVEAVSLIRTIEKPVLACVQGAAAGAGAPLALACDMILASDNMKMSFAYARIGLSPDGSASFFLPRHIGLKKAAELFMLCPQLSATEALQLGLVNWVVPQEEIEEKANEIVNTLAEGPTQCYARCKQLLNQAHNNDLMTQLHLEGDLILESSQTQDFKEGVQAFLEKRQPCFKGE